MAIFATLRVTTVVIWLVLVSSRRNLTKKKETETCGLPTSSMKARVIGGKEVKLGEFPFVVSLTMPMDTFAHCTGTLLNEYWVITAAHCMFDKKVALKDSLLVEAGFVDRRNPGKWKQRIKVQDMITPIEYRKKDGFDLALLKLKTPFHLNKSEGYVGRVCMPESQDPVRDVVVMVGWGCLHEDTRKKARQLQKLEMEVRPVSYCSKRVPPPKLGDNGSKEGVICVTSPLGCGHGLCQGDSGGPILKLKDNRYYLAGVLSYGRPSCQALFTNITQYLSWIKKTVKL